MLLVMIFELLEPKTYILAFSKFFAVSGLLIFPSDRFDGLLHVAETLAVTYKSLW